MSPVHDWKDDAEFIRYNPPERPSRWRTFQNAQRSLYARSAPTWPHSHPWIAVIGVMGIIAFLIYVLFAQLGVINQPQPQPMFDENMVAYDLNHDQALKRDAEVFNEIQHAEPVQ